MNGCSHVEPIRVQQYYSRSELKLVPKNSPSPKVSIFSATRHRQTASKIPSVDDMAGVVVPPVPLFDRHQTTEQYTHFAVLCGPRRGRFGLGRQPA